MLSSFKEKKTAGGGGGMQCRHQKKETFMNVQLN